PQVRGQARQHQAVQSDPAEHEQQQRRGGPVPPQRAADMAERAGERLLLVLREVARDPGGARQRGHDPDDGEDAEHRGPVRGEERGRLREEADHPARGERIAPTDALLRARERGRARGGRGHLIPELAKPCTKYRWKIRNRMIIGTAAIVVPAMSRCQSVDASSRNEEIPTWITRRFSDVVTSSGHRKLFHPCSKLSSATV